jgi:hypothetical protein
MNPGRNSFTNNNKMKKSFLIAFCFILLIGVIVFYSLRVKEKGKKNFEIFYKAKVDGKIETIQLSVGVVYVKLSTSEMYSFIPITAPLNSGTPFYTVAKKGDLLLKMANSDTLRLSNHEKTYLYTFEKF